MKNILITGGCGFIGSNFLNHMVKKYSNFNFINLDAMYYCASKFNVNKNIRQKKNYKFIKGTIQNKELIDHILQEHQIDTIIHFAAQSHVDNSFSNPIQYTKDNILGTHILLEAVRNYNRITKFIHVSTDEVYGESVCHETDIKSEKSKLNPTNPYSATKASAEMIVNSYVYSYNLPIIITRGNNVYGPRQYPEKLIPKFINSLLSNEPCTIHGEGHTERSFLYVDDVARAFELILFKGKIGEIYNIGTNFEYSVLEITKRLITLINNTELEKPNEMEKYIEYVEDRKYNDKRYNISFNKLLALGWKQEIFIDEGLRKTIDYYRKKQTNTNSN
jgi:dTDP-glucose 4,6-dehydratase